MSINRALYTIHPQLAETIAPQEYLKQLIHDLSAGENSVFDKACLCKKCGLLKANKDVVILRNSN
jgi:hypothetical protein